MIHGSVHSGIVSQGENERKEKGTRNARRIAGSGFNRRSGSHVKHLVMKSIKSSSSDLRTWANVFEEGRRRRPFELTTGRGAPVESVGTDHCISNCMRGDKKGATHQRTASASNFYRSSDDQGHRELP